MENTDHISTSPPGSTQDHVHTITDEAGALLGDARQKGTEQFEHYRDTAADQLDSLKEGARSAASALEGNDSLGLSHYLSQAAQCVGEFAEQVRHESAESLLQRGAQLARENPALFLAGSVAVGFAVSRFIRASATSATPGTATTAADREPQPVPAVTPDRGSDVSTREPFTPVDPIGPGAGTPVTGSPFERDPLKGGE
ncbi:hypothetical protein [Pseudomonas putida]|uniref:Uncharacterized protein n=1 Tax=Pseudomonas putida TaxID=303 RepID=A0A6I6XZH7_PSEPU|nr:hypothetical protein [Pseudomonas putida]QHG65645.1 hypothetical protein C2H86_15075 [Pseudomonas putida]